MLSTTYNPAGLLDAVIAKHGLKNDTALANFLNTTPPVISKTRNQVVLISPAMILKCAELGGMDFPAIRAFIGGEA